MAVRIDVQELVKVMNDPSSPVFFGFATLIMFLIFLLGISVFLYNRDKLFYCRRDLFFDGSDKKYRVESVRTPWIWSCYFWTSDQIYSALGLDSLVLLRTTRLFLILSIIIGFITVCSLVPLHIVVGDRNANIFLRSSVYSVSEKSNLMIIHLILICIITCLVCYGLNYQWDEVTKFRQKLFTDDPILTASLLFSDFSKSDLQQASFEEDLTNRIRHISKDSGLMKVHVLCDVNLIKNYIKKHNRLVLKRYQALNQDPLLEEETDLDDETFRYSEDKSYLLDTNLKKNYEKLKERAAAVEKIKLNAAIAVFSNVSTAQLFRCVDQSLKQEGIRISLLPEKTGLIWRNLEASPHIKKLGSGLIWLLAVLFILFSSVPFAVVGSIRRIFLTYYAVNFEGSNSYIAGFLKFLLEVLIPLLLIEFFLWGQHHIFKKLSTFENHVSYADADYSILKKMCIFNAVNTFFIYTLSFTYFVFLPEIFHHPFDLIVDIVPSVPLQSNFYIIFLAYQGLVVLPWILLKGDDYLYESLCLMWSRITSQPQVNYGKSEDRFRPTSSYYIYKYSYLLLIFGVGLVFVVLTPLIALVWVPYFIIAYAIFTYDEERNNVNLFLYHGEFWPIISYVVISYLVFMQLMMIGILTIKKHVLLPTLLCPVIVATLAYIQYLRVKFRKHFKLPTQETLERIEVLKEVDIDKKMKQYSIQSFIPPANKTKSEIKWEYVKERELALKISKS